MGTRLAHISHYPKQMFSSVFLEILCPAIGFVTFHTKWNLPHRMETSSGDTNTEERRSKRQEKLQIGELPSCSIESTGKNSL